MRDEQLTTETLERMKATIPKLNLPATHRAQLLERVTAGLAIIEQLRVNNVAEAFAALAKIRDKTAKGTTDADANRNAN